MYRHIVGSIAVVLCFGSAASAATEVTHKFESAVNAAAIVRVMIEVPVGEVHVRNSTTNRIELSGTFRREYERASEVTAAQRVVDGSSVEIKVSGARAVIRPVYKSAASKWRRRRGTELQINVAIPPGTHLEIRQTAGTATLDGRFADVDVSVRAGDIQARFPKKTIKQLDAKTLLGQVETNFPDETVTREGLFPGGTHFEGGQGDSTVRLHTRAGKIKVELFEAP